VRQRCTILSQSHHSRLPELQSLEGLVGKLSSHIADETHIKDSCKQASSTFVLSGPNLIRPKIQAYQTYSLSLSLSLSNLPHPSSLSLSLYFPLCHSISGALSFSFSFSLLYCLSPMKKLRRSVDLGIELGESGHSLPLNRVLYLMICPFTS
jgi:hypothetical protein